MRHLARGDKRAGLKLQEQSCYVWDNAKSDMYIKAESLFCMITMSVKKFGLGAKVQR